MQSIAKWLDFKATVNIDLNGFNNASLKNSVGLRGRKHNAERPCLTSQMIEAYNANWRIVERKK